MTKTSVFSEKLGAEVVIAAGTSKEQDGGRFISYFYPDGSTVVQDWSQGYWNRQLGDYWNRSW